MQTPASDERRELPNGQGIMLDAASASQDIVYGQTSRPLPNGQGCLLDAGAFVITRQRQNPNSLVRRPGAQMQRFQGPDERQNLGLALTAMQTQTGMVPFLSGRLADGSVVIDTWAEEVADSEFAATAPGTTCLGIVPYVAPGGGQEQHVPDEEAQWIVETSSTNPRRTRKVKFTCNLCGCTTVSPVNPHAYHNGTLFARCGNSRCNVIHKLKDNLTLVHEVKGPVFRRPPRARMPRGLQLPRILPGLRVGGVDILNSRDS